MADFVGIDAPAEDYILGQFSVNGVVSTNFNVVGFFPLNQGLVSSNATTLILDMSLLSGTLDTDEVTIQVQGVTIFTTGSFLGEYTTSTITPQGGGVFRFTLIKDTPWDSGSTQEVRVFPPGESP